MGASMRKERLEQLLQLAQHYRGGNRRDLARSLGRNSARLVPESGVPKLDLVMDISNALDWRVEDVIGHVWGSEGAGDAPPPSDDFAELSQRSRAAHRAGACHEAAQLAQQAHAAAESGEHRAIARVRECVAWDGLGRHNRALDAARAGLLESDITAETRGMLQANLAGQYYTLWHLLESRTLAQELVERFAAVPPVSRQLRVSQAFAHYVRGHCFRRMITTGEGDPRDNAIEAARELERARALYMELAEHYEDDAHAGVANTCLGGIYEAESVLGRRHPHHVLELYERGLEKLVDPSIVPPGDWMESYGWWCVFGCNVALRSAKDAKELQRYVALFTNKADELAERLDNWALRERVFAMDFARRERLNDWTGVDGDWTVDTDDIRVIVGTMGRFPNFHRIGWRILQTAKTVQDN